MAACACPSPVMLTPDDMVEDVKELAQGDFDPCRHLRAGEAIEAAVGRQDALPLCGESAQPGQVRLAV